MTLLFIGNFIYICVSAVIIYHNMVVKKRDWEWLLLFSSLDTSCFILMNYIYINGGF